MNPDENEEKLLRSVALQNARAVLLARERAERALFETKEALERKTLELSQQRESFQVTLSSIGDGVITTDTEGRVTFLNPVAEAMTGWKSEDASGHPLEEVFRIVNEATRATAENPVSKVLREGRVVGLANHTALISRDGRETAIDDSAAPIRDANGIISGVVMVFHDVTERRQADAALRESEKRYAALVSASAQIVWESDADGAFVEYSSSWNAFTGQRFEEMKGWGRLAVIHPENQGLLRAAWEKAKATKTIFTIDYRVRSVSGEWRWTTARAVPLLAPDGSIRSWVGMNMDITEQRRAGENLRESENRKSAILSAALDAIITMDHEGNVADFNPAAEKIFGYSRGEVIGKQLAELIIPERFRQRHYDGLKHYLAVGDGPVLGERIELPALRADGSEFPTELSISRIPGIEPPVFTATLRDITERRKAEELLRRSEEELRALANSIPQLAWMANADGHIFWYNQRWYEYTGTTLEQMEGWGWQSVHDPGMLPVVVERWKHSLETGHPFELEFPLRGVDGIFRWFLTRVNAVRDEKGQVVRWFGTNTNVDEVKRVREDLREETRILELLNDSGRAIASKLDLQSIIQTVTDSATQLAGAKFGAFFYNVINQAGESFMLYTLSGAPREAFEKFGMPRNTPVFNPTFHGDGVLRSADITQDPRYGTMAPHHGMPKGHLPVRSYLAVPVKSRSGEVIGGLFFGHPEAGVFTERAERLAVGVAAQASTAIDNARLYEAAQWEIAERRRAEDSLARRVQLTTARGEISAALATSDQLESVLRRCTEALVNYSAAAFARIWTVDSESVFLKLRASSGLYTHLNGPHSTIRIGEFKIGRIAQFRQPHLTNEVQSDPNISDPAWAKREGMVGFAGYPLIVEDNLLGVIAMFARQAIPDEVLKELSLIADGLAQWIQRKQSEQALREAQEKLRRHAEDLERQVEQRTASLRETIGELETFSYSVSHDMRAPLRAMQSFALILGEDYGTQLDAQGKEYLRRISTAAERMDRLIQDVLTYSRVVRTDLPMVAIDIGRLLQDVLVSYPIFQEPGATVKLEGEFPLVLGIEAVLTQCISNLLGNAVKFVAPGVKPLIRVWSENIGADRARIFFRDNGIGIEARLHSQIFGMFQRVNKTYEGTGIGLSIVKKGAERMGGAVGLESETGSGSTFWLELQRAEEANS